MLIFWRLDISAVGAVWCGVGWGTNVLFDFYSVNVLALPHIRHATLLGVL